MAQTTQSLIETVLRDGGPLTVDEILARATALQPITTKNPRQTIQNALTSSHLCQSTGDGRYVYLPTFIKGACMRLPMDRVVPEQEVLIVGADVLALLWVAAVWRPDTVPTLALDQGPVITLDRQYGRYAMGMWLPMQLPPPFWSWWTTQRETGADALLLCCEDGEAGRYTLRAFHSATVDRDAVAARNTALRDAAAGTLRRTRGMRTEQLAERLLARGIYHGDPVPDPLDSVLYGSEGPFVLDRGLVTYRPDITPAMWRLFGSRLLEELDLEQEILREALDPASSPEPEPELEPEDVGDDTLPEPPPATQGFRLKVRLQWMRSVWRIIEMLDNQTLEDLHLAIQRAFHWDNDHLYAFFLSGRAWDPVTEVQMPFNEEAEPPFTDEVTLAALEPSPGMTFLYLFDFGDELRHEIEVLDAFALPANGTFPRVAESHGKAPPQYPSWE
ncbi:MAG TPA: plasmid pRiA4b ORF-3 family protein [Chloroflexota bacterium]|nr:plasmid pRiA4b ORF-3 family protein [Chloroflexota bacterium]